MKYLNNLVVECTGWDLSTDVCKEKIWDTKFICDTESYKLNQGKLFPSQFNIYTDGSRIGSRVGAGFLIMKGNKLIHQDKFKLPDYATVFLSLIHI